MEQFLKKMQENANMVRVMRLKAISEYRKLIENDPEEFLNFITIARQKQFFNGTILGFILAFIIMLLIS